MNSSPFFQAYSSQGALRILLQGSALLFILVLPFADPSWHPEGWNIILGAVVPAMAPIIFILLMFDVLMCAVLKSDSEDAAEIAKFGFSIKTHLIVGFVLIGLWLASVQGALFA